ncbi:pyridoxamine 5'-phosphate oxidase family protein [Amycolatopsis sp. NPDC051903]|uniref:pyridoxamine 5'-phosphate oxidase family protein n=1 Tax=Amycolatopsis sp. NPDC051903 TaxID=3363936 RepID=UPI0037877E5C
MSKLLAQPNPAVIASVDGDQPVSVPTWYLWERGRVLVNMEAGRKRIAHFHKNPLVALTVLDADSWYTHVSLRGRIMELSDDPDLTTIDRISRHYTARPYPVRDRGRVSAWIEIEQWHGWGRMAAVD